MPRGRPVPREERRMPLYAELLAWVMVLWMSFTALLVVRCWR